MSKRISGVLRRGLDSVHKHAKAVTAAVAVGALTLGSAVASAQDTTLPSTGVDMTGLVTAAITFLGGIVVVVVGGYFAFKMIKIALRWVGRLGG